MTEQTIPNCPYCGSAQGIYTRNLGGTYEARVLCENGGCGSGGPCRESEKKELAEELALEAYMRAWEKFEKAIDLLEWVMDWIANPSTINYDSDEIPADIEDFLRSARLDLDRRAGVGHNYRAPGGAKKHGS